VRSGRYADASDVMRDALRMLEQRDEFESPALEAPCWKGCAVLTGLTGKPRWSESAKPPERPNEAQTSISGRAEADLTNQYRWYRDNAGEPVAERILEAFDVTVTRLEEFMKNFKGPFHRL